MTEYEPEGGRVLSERFGGDESTEPLHGVRYTYTPESAAPWPDSVTRLEAVPGQPDLVETFSTMVRRDAFGRPLEERRSDGSVLTSVYDRGGGLIRARTGAGTEAATSFDGRGLPVRVERPRGRGYTLYSYDLDGSRLREATRTAAAGLWETAYAYDSTGRVTTVGYADGTAETLTYNPDSTVATRRDPGRGDGELRLRPGQPAGGGDAGGGLEGVEGAAVAARRRCSTPAIRWPTTSCRGRRCSSAGGRGRPASTRRWRSPIRATTSARGRSRRWWGAAIRSPGATTPGTGRWR